LPKGKALVKHAVVAIENADDSFFACLTDGELSAYKTLAIKIISNNNL
jgi:hypothetical protein